MQLIDSHAHLDTAKFDDDRDQVLDRAREAGVQVIVNIGNGETMEEIGRALALAKQYAGSDPELLATCGVHPHDADKIQDGWWDELGAMGSDPLVRAIGETGLDYHYDHSDRAAQRRAFERHVALAHELGKPLVCHVRDAHDDAVAILSSDEARQTGGVIHCFTGGPADAERYVALGFHISFSGIVTFKTAQNIRDALPLVPRELLLVETDSPYLAPVPLRGKRNEPAFVAHTARFLAAELGIEPDELARVTAANALELFASRS